MPENIQEPKFTFDDVKYAESPAMYKRALDLYQSGKVQTISEESHGYSTTVEGTEPYKVTLSRKEIDHCDCSCYMGERGLLCKHVLALAIAVLHASGKMTETKSNTDAPEDLKTVKQLVNDGMRKLRPYTGPSRIWFSYTRKLSTGAEMINHAVSGLLPSKENARYLWDLVKRIDKKLVNGIDDSDGAVGNCARIIIEQLAAYVKELPELESTIRKYSDQKTNFDFEKDLFECLRQ